MFDERTRHRATAPRPTRRVAWPLALALWMAGHAAWAQLLVMADALVERGRWRPDDPDIVRAGDHATLTDALAPGARVLRQEPVDVDDPVTALALEIAPREDPAPQNENRAVVLAVHDAQGWQATVVARAPPPPPWSEEDAAEPPVWRVLREGGRRRLVLLFRDMSHCENGSGHGHHGLRQDAAVRLTVRGAEVRADGHCTQGYDDEDGAIPLRLQVPYCYCTDVYSGFSARCGCGSGRALTNDRETVLASLLPEARARFERMALTHSVLVRSSDREPAPPPPWCRVAMRALPP